MAGRKRIQRARTLRSKTVFKGRVFQVRTDTVIEPGGVRATRDLVVHPGSVVVLPERRDGRILLVRQYRHSVGNFLWELVAGRKEPGESPVRAARRELAEETGYAARRLRKLLDVFPTPGFASERMWVYLAEGLTAGRATPEDDERIEPRWFTLAQADTMIRTGRLRDAKSVAGILYYLRYIRRAR